MHESFKQPYFAIRAAQALLELEREIYYKRKVKEAQEFEEMFNTVMQIVKENDIVMFSVDDD